MSCLFCGKEIGPLRLLRREEFCSAAHRSLYKKRLGKALGAIGAPEPPPPALSGFRPILRPAVGVVDGIASLEFAGAISVSCLSCDNWPLAIPPVLGGDRRPLFYTPAAPRQSVPNRFLTPSPADIPLQSLGATLNFDTDFERLCEVAALSASNTAGIAAMEGAPASNTAGQLASDLSPAAAPAQLPLFDFTVNDELQRLQEVHALLASELGESAPSLEAQPVARWVEACDLAEAIPPVVAVALPAFRVANRRIARPPLCGVAGSQEPEAGRGPDSAAVLPFRHPQRLPRFEMAACVEPLPEPRPEMSENWMPSPAAVPAARMVFAGMSEAVAESTVEAVLPKFEMAACADPVFAPENAIPPVSETWMPSPAAMPVARMVFAGMSEAVAESTVEAVLPKFEMAACADPVFAPQEAVPPVCETWMPSPAAMPVARMVFAGMSEAVAESTVEAVLPKFEMAACADPAFAPQEAVPPVCETWMVSPAAMPVARMVFAGMSEAVAESTVEAVLPKFEVAACADPVFAPENAIPPVSEMWMPSPAAMPVARMVLAGMSDAVAESTAAAALPHFEIAACLEPLREPKKAEPRPPMSEVWMPSPAPMLVARMVAPALEAAPLTAVAAAAARSAVAPEAARPNLSLPSCSLWAPVPEAEAALVNAFPSLVTDSAVTGTVELPGMPGWRASDAMRDPHAGPALTAEPEPVEAWIEAQPEPVPTESTPRLCLPVLALDAVSGSARLECSAEPDMAPRPALPAPAATRVVAPMLRTAPGADTVRFVRYSRKSVALPVAGFAEPEFHCRPTAGVVAKRLRPLPPAPQTLQPRMTVRPAFERWEELAPHPAKKQTSNVVSIRRSVVQTVTSKRTRNLMGTIAAGLFLGTAFYFGALSGRRQHVPVEEPVASNDAPISAPVRKAPTGTFSRFRQAVADRAAASWSDSFHGNLEQWGGTAKAPLPGWSRSADGYVQPSSLAIFRPSANYTNYQLEFFGQIEKSSMDWVVRAQDPKNYYAMKLKVIESGLRPIVAMVHYTVTDGKRGRSHELPLVNLMVHNSRPMQVLVDVAGNRFTASVDGQQVDSWTDNAPSTGGVGFFAEAGEKARLYWMRVSKNQDFIGRVCAYFSGSTTTAELWPQNPYGGPHSRTDNESQPAEACGVAVLGVLKRKRNSRVRS